MSADAEHWVRTLGLVPHPEGGCFRETWRAEEARAEALPGRFEGPRAFGTAILYLLRAGEFSCFHRLRGDEVWHLYDGGPLWLHVLVPGGEYVRHVLGRDGARGERPQHVVAHGRWFAAEPAPGTDFALTGCTVSPGFEYEDLEMAERAALRAAWPGHAALVDRLTPEPGAV